MRLFPSASFVCATMMSCALSANAAIFTETMGTPSATTSITLYTGFSNPGVLTYAGTGDVRTTTPSTYSGASASGNVFLTNTSLPRTFIISSISTIGYTPGSLDLSFGVFKSTIPSTLSDFALDYSTDGAAWTSVSIPVQASGTGTAVWRLITLTDTAIPISSTLSLRFSNTATATQYRIDDVKLDGSAIPEPASLGLAAIAIIGLGRRRR